MNMLPGSCQAVITGVLGFPGQPCPASKRAAGLTQLHFSNFSAVRFRVISRIKWYYRTLRGVRRWGSVAWYDQLLCLSHSGLAPSGGMKPAWRYGCTVFKFAVTTRWLNHMCSHFFQRHNTIEMSPSTCQRVNALRRRCKMGNQGGWWL